MCRIEDRRALWNTYLCRFSWRCASVGNHLGVPDTRRRHSAGLVKLQTEQSYQASTIHHRVYSLEPFFYWSSLSSSSSFHLSSIKLSLYAQQYRFPHKTLSAPPNSPSLYLPATTTTLLAKDAASFIPTINWYVPALRHPTRQITLSSSTLASRRQPFHHDPLLKHRSKTNSLTIFDQTTLSSFSSFRSSL